MKDQTQHCRTLCECGMHGFPVRLVPGNSSYKFDIKAGDVLLMSLSISRVRRPREDAVMVGDLSGRVSFSKARRLRPEQAIQFIQDLGIPDEFFRSHLVVLGWVKRPASVTSELPPDHWLEAAYESRTELAD